MLKNTTDIDIRFSEVDSMAIVWHGHFIKYFEDGREAFGKEFDLGYFQVFDDAGFYMPIVEVNCQYKNPIKYLDKVTIETTFKNTKAAKIQFNYRLYNRDTGMTYATGNSTQIFLNKDRELHLTVPEFFIEWKKKHGIAVHENVS